MPDDKGDRPYPCRRVGRIGGKKCEMRADVENSIPDLHPVYVGFLGIHGGGQELAQRHEVSCRDAGNVVGKGLGHIDQDQCHPQLRLPPGRTQ